MSKLGCWEHGRAPIGTCVWCGKPLCEVCIAREDGKKIYCRKCAGPLNEIKPSQKPKPLMREIEESEIPDKVVSNIPNRMVSNMPNRMVSNMPNKVVRKVSPEAYEIGKGYVLRKPMPVEKPKTIERELPQDKQEENVASKNALGFLQMQQIFDNKQVQRQQEPQQPRQPQREQPSFMSRVSESTSKMAAQNALQFLAQKAKETEAKFKE